MVVEAQAISDRLAGVTVVVAALPRARSRSLPESHCPSLSVPAGVLVLGALGARDRVADSRE